MLLVLTLVQVKSCEVAPNKSPAERFAHLYDLYHEGKSDTPDKTQKATEQEILKLRQQIRHLKESTRLTVADKALLHDLQARLKAATGGAL